MFHSRYHFGLLFLFVFVSGLVACSSPSGGQAGSGAAPTGTPAHHTVGEHVVVGPWMITIADYSSSGDTSYTPKAGDGLLVFNINQQNRGSQPVTAHGAADWSLRDDQGTAFPLITQSGYGTFPATSVAAGETATGTLVYEVPTSTRHVLLTFAPATGGTQATWDVPLG